MNDEDYKFCICANGRQYLYPDSIGPCWGKMRVVASPLMLSADCPEIGKEIE